MSSPPVEFKGTEPSVDFFPNRKGKEKLMVHDLPASEDIIKRHWKKQKTEEEKASTYRQFPPLSNEIEEVENPDEISLDERKEEIQAARQLEGMGNEMEGAILERLNQLMDSKFAAIFKKLNMLDARIERIERLLKAGCKENDAYWGFGNPKPLNPYGILQYVANKGMAMIYSAIDKNGGTLYDDGTTRRKRPDY